MTVADMAHTFDPVQQIMSQAHFSHILIIEDDPAQLRTLTKIMEAEGFTVVGCQLAQDGLQQIRQTPFGVIIIDLNLPDLYGITVVEQIRQMTDHGRIIVHTGYGSFSSAKALLNLGVFALVEKLSDPQELVGHVHRAMHDQMRQYAQTLEYTVAERTNQLRETEIWLKLAQSAADVGTWDWDLGAQTARCSTTCLRLYGHEPRDAKVSLKEWIGTLYPNDAPQVLQKVDEAIEGGVIYASEHRIVWPNGRVHWVAERGQVLYNTTGEPVHFIGATIDITARIEAQQALRQAYSELERRVQDRTAELQQANRRLLAEIEERRKTEHALRLANFALDHAADAIFLAGPDARFFYVNEAVCQMHGYTREELLTMRVHDLNSKLGEWLVTHRQNVEAAPFAYCQECYNQTRHGRIFPVEFTINDLEFNGTPYICVIVRDITERKAAESQRRQQTLALMSLWQADIFKQGRFIEALREISRVAAETLDVARVGVWLFSGDRTKIQCINLYELPTAQHSAGYELLAVDYPAYFQALEEDRIIVADNAHTDPQTREFATSYLVPLQITAILDAPIRMDDGLAGVICHEQVGSPRVWTVEEQSFANALADLLAIVIQTNKRFRIEQKLRESEELRELAVQGADLALWDWNVQSGAIQVDERWAAIRGYQLDEIEGHIDFWLNLVHPDDRPELRVKLNQHLAGETPFYQTEYRTQTKDGQWRWILSRGKVVKWDAAGYPLHFLGTQLDITDYKQLEQQLLQAQKMEAVGRLAGGVAHDFNNILTVIISYSELLLRRNDLDARVRLRIDEIKKAGERAALLTQQLLAFSRKQVMTPVVLDLNLVVTEMDQMLRRLIGEDIDLQLALTPDACWVKADPVQVEQVIMNLLVNARDAMPTGGEIIISTNSVRPTNTAPQLHHWSTASEYILLTIADSGMGMDAETQARIFEPFFTTKEAGKGTGLGLSTVFGIVQQHNGYIEVESEIGRGTTFRIYLPVAAPGAPQLSPPPVLPELSADAVHGGAKTILLVEDEAQIRMLAAVALQEAGYTVLVAANGQEALALAEQEQESPVHLLITDVVMPGMSGAQLSDQLQERYSVLKTLYISGYADSNLAFPVMKSTKQTAYLPKPFPPSALIRKARDLLAE